MHECLCESLELAIGALRSLPLEVTRADLQELVGIDADSRFREQSGSKDRDIYVDAATSLLALLNAEDAGE